MTSVEASVGYPSDNAPAPITIEVRTLEVDGLPSDQTLASGTFWATDTTWSSVEFATPLSVTAGDKFALVVSSNANWQVAMHPFDIYPDESYHNIQGVWTKWTNDLAFRTYVIPAEVDPVDPTIEEVIATTVTDPDVAASLQDMVDQIKNAPNAKAKAGKLKAFLNQLKAQTGKSISEEDAETLAEMAKDL